MGTGRAVRRWGVGGAGPPGAWGAGGDALETQPWAQRNPSCDDCVAQDSDPSGSDKGPQTYYGLGSASPTHPCPRTSAIAAVSRRTPSSTWSAVTAEYASQIGRA